MIDQGSQPTWKTGNGQLKKKEREPQKIRKFNEKSEFFSGCTIFTAKDKKLSEIIIHLHGN